MPKIKKRTLNGKKADLILLFSLEFNENRLFKMTLIDNPQGNYRFLTGIAPYSSGVVAMSGFEIIRVRLLRPLPIAGLLFNRIAQHLSDVGQPIQALCSMELRIPAPLSFEGFKEFNNQYQEMLKNQGLLLGDVNPVARTNIAPAEFDLKEPSVYAFSYTIPIHDGFKRPSFIVAGAGDLVDQADLSSSAIIRPNETSINALEEKANVVMKVMQERLSGLLTGWEGVSNISIYTAIPLHALIVDTILKPIGAAALQGVTWYYSNPPIKGLVYEMDVRGVRKELIMEL